MQPPKHCMLLLHLIFRRIIHPSGMKKARRSWTLYIMLDILHSIKKYNTEQCLKKRKNTSKKMYT